MSVSVEAKFRAPNAPGIKRDVLNPNRFLSQPQSDMLCPGVGLSQSLRKLVREEERGGLKDGAGAQEGGVLWVRTPGCQFGSCDPGLPSPGPLSWGGRLCGCGWRGRLGPEPGRLPTCMVMLAVSRGTQCIFSSLQQPVQRSRETQDGLNRCSISLGYSDTMSTNFSTGRQ